MQFRFKFILKLNKIDTKSLSHTIRFPAAFGAENDKSAAVPIEPFRHSWPGLRQTASESMARAKAPRVEGVMMTSGVKLSSISGRSEKSRLAPFPGGINGYKLQNYYKANAIYSFLWYLACSSKWPQIRVRRSLEDREIDCWASGRITSLFVTVKQISLIQNVLGLATKWIEGVLQSEINIIKHIL